MNIRNIAVIKHFIGKRQPVSLEFMVEIETRKMLSVHVQLPLSHEDFPETMRNMGIQVMHLIEDEILTDAD